MSKYGGVPVEQGSKYGGVFPSREPQYNRLNPSLPGYQEPASYTDPEQRINYTPETWRASKKSKEEREQIMSLLQEKYGDETTIKRGEYRRRLGPMKGVYKGTVTYDEGELLKRYAKDKWGSDVPPSRNPLVHAGHTIDQLITGIGQINPFRSDEAKDKSWKDYQQRELIYEAGDQPLWAQITGDVMLGAGPMIANTPVKAAVGRVIKNRFSKDLGEKMLRDAAFTGLQTPPKLAPGYVGATEGAIYGGLQPMDPSLDSSEQWSQRGRSTVGGAILGTIGEVTGRYLGKKLQQDTTRRLKKEIQGSLPKPIDMPTPLLYGNVPGFEVLKEAAQSGNKDVLKGTSLAAQQGSRKMISDFKKSIQSNFVEMNRQMSRSVVSPNMKVGTSIKPVLREAARMERRSWAEVGKGYDRAIKNPNRLTGDYIGYRTFLTNLEEELETLGMPVKKASLTALNQLKKVKATDQEQLVFNGKSLMSRYKALNSLYKGAKPDDRVIIDHMRRKLIDYMENGRFRGDESILSDFRSATRKASEHYNYFKGDKILDKYYDGAITENDVSARIFKGTSLDQNEGPKLATLNKILSIFKNNEATKGRLRNEVFASLSDEWTTSKQALDAIPRIKKHILSGTEDGVYGTLFNKKQMKQFEDLITATDIGEGVIGAQLEDVGRTIKETNRLAPRPWEKNPVGMMSPKARELALVKRAEAGKIAPSGDLGFGVSTPFALGGAQIGQEDQTLDSLMRRLYVTEHER